MDLIFLHRPRTLERIKMYIATWASSFSGLSKLAGDVAVEITVTSGWLMRWFTALLCFTELLLGTTSEYGDESLSQVQLKAKLQLKSLNTRE